MYADPKLTRSVKGQVTADEWAVRTDLAAAYRAVALYGWDDLVFTHISARVPGRGTISSSIPTG
jgi:ribulose-5-phosphate 4-epimerase/fuculose-1-phosphate aldolase